MGLVHLYIGDGKGKTTAAIGLSVRAAGRGKTVVFAQFLKTENSGELASMEKLGIRVIRSTLRLGFTYQMDENTRGLCREEQGRIMAEAVKAAEGADLLILDEVLDAVYTEMLEEGKLRSFTEHRGPVLELVITGRNPPAWLLEGADYVSEIKKIRHPYDQGIQARIGIER
jgi:cob(I)alamin adenosyltransferase